MLRWTDSVKMEPRVGENGRRLQWMEMTLSVMRNLVSDICKCRAHTRSPL